ncbi:hypothetical protein PVK06_044550 [Gossypium arboreum]|uniref:Uncharacterized protein n=1 Tax=Gossypium arboreum TaxID=29729 RepID=A0ABR0MRL7_GOSAR|nr:hypothetical protein PVK06_044550 [Gossypium arboreum]
MLRACDLLNVTGIIWDKELIDSFLAPGFEGVGSYVVVVHGGDRCLGQGRDCAPVVNSTWLAHFAAIGCSILLLDLKLLLVGHLLQLVSANEAFSWLKDQGMDNMWKPIVGKLCLPFVQTMKTSRNSALWLMIVECCKLHFNMSVSLGSSESLIRLLISWVG